MRALHAIGPALPELWRTAGGLDVAFISMRERHIGNAWSYWHPERTPESNYRYRQMTKNRKLMLLALFAEIARRGRSEELPPYKLPEF